MMTEHKGQCCVIFAGYEDRMNHMMRNSNPGLRERFPFKLIFDDYSTEELMDIFMGKLEYSKLRISKEGQHIVSGMINMAYENRNEEFSNAREVENVFQEIVLQQERRLFLAHTQNVSLTARTLFSITKADCESAVRIISAGSNKTLKMKQAIGFSAGS